MHGNMPPDPGGAVERDAMKAAAAHAAVDEVASGMVLGLGTGSTAAHAVREIAERLAAGRIDDVAGIPTSLATEDLARELGIPLLEPGAAPIDLAIDGADEIAPDLALTKGGGGALLREKVIAASAARFVVISDDSKMVEALGATFDIPLEVAQFGLAITATALQRLGRPQLRIAGEAPVVTDNGNYIIDLAVDPIRDAATFDAELHMIPGVLATGLFVGIAAAAYVAGSSGIRRIEAGEPA
jgi:ribose 5-phosphate isomerase A